jgi:hypothetical protein
MQEHPGQVGPLSVARTCAHSVQTKGSNGHYRPLVAWEEYDPRVTEAGALPTFPCGLILLWGRSEAYKIRAMQDPASELRRIPKRRSSQNSPSRADCDDIDPYTRHRCTFAQCVLEMLHKCS